MPSKKQLLNRNTKNRSQQRRDGHWYIELDNDHVNFLRELEFPRIVKQTLKDNYFHEHTVYKVSKEEIVELCRLFNGSVAYNIFKRHSLTDVLNPANREINQCLN